LLTQTIGVAKADVDAPFLSTIPDAILLLDYDSSAKDLARTIQVLKMRGSPHVTERRRVHIVQGGLDISPVP